MPPLVVCELCERSNIEVAGITHFGGHRFEVCSDCRTIVSEMRGKIAQLPERLRDIESRGNRTGDILFWTHYGKGSTEATNLVCPNCGRKGTLGLGSADGRPGCHACLWEVNPVRHDVKGKHDL